MLCASHGISLTEGSGANLVALLSKCTESVVRLTPSFVLCPTVAFLIYPSLTCVTSVAVFLHRLPC